MSKEAIERDELLDNVMRQLQITQNVVEQLRLSVTTLTGGKLHAIPIPEGCDKDADNFPRIEVPVPVCPVLITYKAINVVKKSKILGNDGVSLKG